MDKWPYFGNLSHIEEITGQNFHETVMDKELNVVLLYQTKSCAFCTAASSAAAAFHSVMRIVTGGGGSGDHSPGSKKRPNGIQSKIKFVTIDAAHNDLPWEFTALSVPTVLFFPASSGNVAESKSDTRVFPSSKTLTTSNLLNFVLANLSPQDRLEFVSDFQVGRQQTTLSDIDILPTHTELWHQWDYMLYYFSQSLPTLFSYTLLSPFLRDINILKLIIKLRFESIFLRWSIICCSIFDALCLPH